MKEITQTKSEVEHWDMELHAGFSLWDINLKEIWRYRDLIGLFVKRDFAAQYKQTVLGPVWHIIQPVLTTIVFLLIFGKIAGIPTGGIEPVLFYMSGITLWNYFATCLTATSNTFAGNANIFGKVYFPRLVIPISTIISNLIRFGIQFLLLLAAMVWFRVFKQVPIQFGINWLWLPFFIFLMAGIGFGLGIIISSLTTKYRDFTVLVSFGVQLLMYATPVVYPLAYLQGKSFAAIINLNPLGPVVEGFRYALFGGQYYDWNMLLYSIGFMIVLLVVGIAFFSKVERSFMDTV
jgi:lipopolysaccharide transport system permease protein